MIKVDSGNRIHQQEQEGDIDEEDNIIKLTRIIIKDMN